MSKHEGYGHPISVAIGAELIVVVFIIIGAAAVVRWF